MIVEVSMSDEEFKFISEYAAQENLSISDFIVSAVMEQIEDREDLKLYEKAEAEFNADPVTYSHEEVKKILVLTDDS